MTKFLAAAHGNRYATFVKKREATTLLIQIDACFFKVVDGWINPRPWFPGLLYLRSHAAFRAACGYSLSGQTADAYPLLRTCLEFAAYALHMTVNPTLQAVWLRRHDDDDCMRAVKTQFTVASTQHDPCTESKDRRGLSSSL
ncbi:MAG: hypothetical protein AB7J28_01150 [Hyphomonadaceae bacterium]